MNIVLQPGKEQQISIEDDAELVAIFEKQRQFESAFNPIGAKRGGGDEWYAPLDLRVNRPYAVDLRKLWDITGQAVPAEIEAMLGHRIPVLLHHVVTPFPMDGKVPGGVWGLGYEFVNNSANANTISVLPSDEVLNIGSIGSEVELGVDLSGGVGVPDASLECINSIPGVNLSGAKLHASTHQKFQFSLKMALTLRKVVGAPVGEGGALWKMYRQNEPLDRPHTLLQTVMLADGAREIKCTIRTWAKQAGWFGTRLGAKYWPYEDLAFTVNLGD